MADFIDAKNVFVEEDLTSRDAVLNFISKKAVELNYAKDSAEVRAAFDAREELGATGLQDGFAIPHAKSEAIEKPGVIVVKLHNPVEWPSFDSKPVSTIISLLVPEGEAGVNHIKLLSRVAVLLMRDQFRQDVRGTNDPQKIAQFINQGLEN